MKKLALLLLVGCTPISAEKLPEVMRAMHLEGASGCIWVGGRGGAGSPVGVPAGGYGSGEILVGRVRTPNTQLRIENGSCSIESGNSQIPVSPDSKAEPDPTPPHFTTETTAPRNFDPCEFKWVSCGKIWKISND